MRVPGGIRRYRFVPGRIAPDDREGIVGPADRRVPRGTRQVPPELNRVSVAPQCSRGEENY